MKFGNIVATMESLAEGVEHVEAQDGVEAQETATEVAEVAGKTSAVEQQVEGTDAAIDDAFEAGDKVAELTEVAEASLGKDGEGPGLTEGEAALVEITHESILSSIGLPYQRQVFTAESFGSNARETTRATLEGLMDSAKDIGGKIVAALKAALNTVMNFLAGLIKNRALMDKHLANLQAKVGAVDASAVQKEKELTAGAKALSVGGKAGVDTAMKLLAEGTKVIGVCGQLAEALKKEGMPDITSPLKGLTKTSKGVGLLSGDRTMVTHGEDGAAQVQLVQVSEPAQKIAAPSVADMTKLLAEARKVLASLREMEKTQSRLKDAVNAIIARLGEGVTFVKSKVGSEEGKAKAAGELEAKQKARAARSVMSKAGGTLPGAVFAVVKGVADYVTAGLNNYGAKAEEKKEEAKK